MPGIVIQSVATRISHRPPFLISDAVALSGTVLSSAPGSGDKGGWNVVVQATGRLAANNHGDADVFVEGEWTCWIGEHILKNK
jgi:hypothetical protein